jgi:pimeloyl-ACP methyl ester carboxylesterase
VGPDKPLKDLAWGLAGRGVAVLRTDKTTHTHPGLVSAPGFTMVEEYLPSALAALDLLRRQAGVAGERVHLLGHSAGGRAAPRIAAADGSVAGLIVLAGDAAPLPQARPRPRARPARGPGRHRRHRRLAAAAPDPPAHRPPAHPLTGSGKSETAERSERFRKSEIEPGLKELPNSVRLICGTP